MRTEVHHNVLPCFRRLARQPRRLPNAGGDRRVLRAVAGATSTGRRYATATTTSPHRGAAANVSLERARQRHVVDANGRNGNHSTGSIAPAPGNDAEPVRNESPATHLVNDSRAVEDDLRYRRVPLLPKSSPTGLIPNRMVLTLGALETVWTALLLPSSERHQPDHRTSDDPVASRHTRGHDKCQLWSAITRCSSSSVKWRVPVVNIHAAAALHRHVTGPAGCLTGDPGAGVGRRPRLSPAFPVRQLAHALLTHATPTVNRRLTAWTARPKG